MKNKLKVVLDTNILLVSISSKSKYHWIFQKLLSKEFELFVSNEIILEYEEIISKKFNRTVAGDIIKVLLILPNVSKIPIHYNWNLIKEDEDDNKFVDCALSSNAHLLVTNDKHFNHLKKLEFPKITIVNIQEFSLALQK